MTQLRCSALRRVPLALVLLAVMLGLFTALANPASAQTASTLYAFGGFPDGNHPSGGLISDAKGNLYGTTTFGGKLRIGTVFRVP